MTKLGTTIRTRLQQLSKTQVWLADELGVSNNAVSKWIATGKISRENSIAAAKALDISVDELLGEESAGRGQDEDSADEVLRKAAEMLEIYRLASPDDRERIDLAFMEARSNLGTSDQAKPRAR